MTKKASEIKLVILNPEALPRAKEVMDKRSKELAQRFREILLSK